MDIETLIFDWAWNCFSPWSFDQRERIGPGTKLVTKHLFSGDGIWPIINPPLTDFVWELCAKWPFISSAQTELRKIVELKAYLINAETFSSWGMSWNWEFYRRRQIQWLMHPRHLPLTNWNRGSQRKKERFSILSRIHCWHWSLTSPYRMDLELLTKSVKHLTKL